MKIDWSALGLVLMVAVVATVVLVTLFSTGIQMRSRREQALAAGQSAVPATAASVVAFGLCAVIVAFGIYLIVA